MGERKLDAREMYWREAAMCALDEAGVSLDGITSDQLDWIGVALNTSAECQSMAFHVPENPMRGERDSLTRKLKWERELVGCEQCKGRGRIITPGPYHSSDSECWKCRGDGKVHPRDEREPA